jgi:translation initiation factor 2 beta subunit (eIF-2beta)/eIF-5
MKISEKKIREIIAEELDHAIVSDLDIPSEIRGDGFEETPGWYTSIVKAIDRLRDNQLDIIDHIRDAEEEWAESKDGMWDFLINLEYELTNHTDGDDHITYKQKISQIDVEDNEDEEFTSAKKKEL